MKADTRPYFVVLVGLILVAILGIVGQCEYKEKQEAEARISELTQEQKREVMQRTGYEEAMHIEYADRVLTARTERNWRESR